MPTDDYATTGGSLKLKGVQGSKIHKKKKKKKSKEGDVEKSVAIQEQSEQAEGSEKPHSETEADTEDLKFVGKTEAEKRYEEVKRKRVGFIVPWRFLCLLV
jgi:protein FAM32A